jgi:hypothetical protein
MLDCVAALRSTELEHLNTGSAGATRHVCRPATSGKGYEADESSPTALPGAESTEVAVAGRRSVIPCRLVRALLTGVRIDVRSSTVVVVVRTIGRGSLVGRYIRPITAGVPVNVHLCSCPYRRRDQCAGGNPCLPHREKPPRLEHRAHRDARGPVNVCVLNVCKRLWLRSECRRWIAADLGARRLRAANAART